MIHENMKEAFPTKVWRRGSGGCHLRSDNYEYPCKDEYEHEKTGERITVYTTHERHFDMPEAVDNPSELYALAGVKPEWLTGDSEDWKQGESDE